MKGEKRGEDDNLEGNPLGLGIGSNHQLMQCNLTNSCSMVQVSVREVPSWYLKSIRHKSSRQER